MQEIRIEGATLDLRVVVGLRKSSAVFGCLQSARGKTENLSNNKKARKEISYIPL